MTLVDKYAVEKFNTPISKMMELAGRNLSDFTLKILKKPHKVIVLYGKGNNGGDGLAAAKYLARKKVPIIIVPASSSGNSNVKFQLKELKKLNIKPNKDFSVEKGDVIMDTLLGYNIKGNPKPSYAKLINLANKAKKKQTKIIACDLPSGLDPDTGKPNTPTIKADYTLTLALPKIGLKKARLKNLYLINIGVPAAVYKFLKIPYKNPFKKGNIVKI